MDSWNDDADEENDDEDKEQQDDEQTNKDDDNEGENGEQDGDYQDGDENKDDEHDEDSETNENDEDDEEYLRTLMAEIEKLHEEFNNKSSAWKSVLRPSWLHLSDALEKVLQLAVLVPEVCPKDRDAYWKHEAEFSNGTLDEALERLKNASHAAYTAIQGKGSQLDAEQETVRQSFAISQDLIGRLEQVENKSDSFLAKMKTLQTNSEVTLTERISSQEEAMAKYTRAVKDAQATMEKIKRKHEVNSNVFSGLVDWISRKDDQFDLALSLGIGEEQEREKDRQTVNYYQNQLKDEADSVRSAHGALEKVIGLLNRIDTAKQILDSTSARTQTFKSNAVKTSSEFSKRKDALQQVASKLFDIKNTIQNIDEEKNLPTVGRMSVEILAVLLASVKYQDFDAISLRDVNKGIWDALVNNNDWQLSFDEDEEAGFVTDRLPVLTR